ncbi:hypothetical protein [Thermotoga sp.]|uniref:hypothetical protein n=1 Tax=Thermotoga sp. TaxID=28240 RepID=UPI0025D736CA|nr:hypothetical protein [Thermotoga sp.]MCD6551376.1 hypothetical protein [Thermotoga sp.]
MKGRIRRIEKKLSQNRETKVVVIERNWDSQKERSHYFASLEDTTLEFPTKDEMERYFDELGKKQNCEYQLIIIDLVDTPQNALEK